MTHTDAGWGEVERRMSAPWVRPAAAAFVGAVSGALFFDAGWGPTWAQCLCPALAGLVEGLLLAEEGVKALPQGGSARPLRRFAPLRLPALAAFVCAAA